MLANVYIARRNPLEEVRPVRNNLCELLGLPVPKQKVIRSHIVTGLHVCLLIG